MKVATLSEENESRKVRLRGNYFCRYLSLYFSCVLVMNQSLNCNRPLTDRSRTEGRPRTEIKMNYFAERCY
jgi:hypothetical protein